nr:uncharacterized protein CTRU02_07942 [Colletotrichum truncatum]KAF6790422.1 hypothetical protein CTRU02_07942 [Colletotrichum truncatum]
MPGNSHQNGRLQHSFKMLFVYVQLTLVQVERHALISIRIFHAGSIRKLPQKSCKVLKHYEQRYYSMISNGKQFP